MTERNKIKIPVIPASLLKLAEATGKLAQNSGFQATAKLLEDTGIQSQLSAIQKLPDGLPEFEIIEDRSYHKYEEHQITREQIARIFKDESRKQTKRNTAREALRRALPKITETKTPNTTKNAVTDSGLLRAPSRKDSWFYVIDDMAREFYKNAGKIPNEHQAWSQLSTNPPYGYEVQSGFGKGEACLTMPGEKDLPRSAFTKRWEKYTTNT